MATTSGSARALNEFEMSTGGRAGASRSTGILVLLSLPLVTVVFAILSLPLVTVVFTIVVVAVILVVDALVDIDVVVVSIVGVIV